ncbi:50S ribosomal protein L18e [Metallosphaera javensis (ex Sakai et al. 2022)]|uniref:50S ribosomal protein L18e n=1 Tax=Metallosphaera javensis (ex Sakai et al. 2022) TaxID=2775498 RepID=UPI00258B83C1|nr:MAG: 50S ribosomal protein L18e [Metallosphaera javensis (ex Sakai et al. 2022)]
MKRTGSTNIEKRKLIRSLAKQEKPLWKAVAKELDVPARKMRTINLYKIDKYTKEGDIVVVPGKVLGVGNISHKVTVFALDFSQNALNKIRGAGGKALPLSQGVEEIKGKVNVRLMSG